MISVIFDIRDHVRDARDAAAIELGVEKAE